MNEKENTKICKFFLKNNCTHGDKCKFIHDKTICKNYFFDGTCKQNDNCKFKHTIKLNHKPKNTENFKPSYEPADMNILVGIPNQNKFYKTIYKPNDVIIVPNFLEETVSNDLYNKLLKEIKESGIDEKDLWKLWHGDSQLIADDNLHWKDKVPTFQYILDKITSYFNVTIKNTRFNLYKDSNDWKPYHHDAAAVKEHIAKIQNFTVGISLGATREISFEHVKSKTIISIPLLNCTAYAFSKDVNVEWKHGVPKIHPDNSFNEGRISIIAWCQS
jgi:hypothetical protein